MNRQWRKVLAAALVASLSVTALSACSKKEEDNSIDKAAAYITLENGGSMSAGAANLILRYQQAEMENGFGSFIKAYYGDIWTSDLTGTGEAYGDYFKEELVHEMQHMLLAEAHMEEMGVELTAEEEEAIEAAAKQFISDNADYADALEKMTADEDTVKEMLRYYTIQSKVEAAAAADVDTEVSDEEAAQRTVNYIYFTASTEAEEEETEALTEADSEDGESVAEMVSSEAAAEAETDVKTSSAGETEPDTESGESVAEAAEGAENEASTEEETEEAETESAEMIAARAETLEKAEAFLAEARSFTDAAEFEAAADAVTEEDSRAYASTYTFGEGDSWPDEAIIEATAGLEDNTLVDQVIVVDTNYYVVYVADAFDEEATAEEKENIVEERREEAIEAQFEEWEADAVFDVDGDISNQMLFDFALAEEAESEEDFDLEYETEFDTESASEGLSESTAELVG